MKKILAILAATVAVALAFVSCNKSGLGPDGTLNGTTWVASDSYSEQGATVTVSISLTFTKSTFTMTASASGSYGGQTIDVGSESVSGNYSVSGSKVTLTATEGEAKGEAITGTLSGNKLTFTGADWGFSNNELVFTRK